MRKNTRAKSLAGAVAFVALAVILFPSLTNDRADSAVTVESIATTTETTTTAVSETPATEAPPVETSATVVTSSFLIGDYAEDGTYDRDLFGAAWADVDSNGCDTRNDILTRDIVNAAINPDCKVQSGSAVDPYTGLTLDFVRGQGTSNLVPIDHIVALGDAWYAGASNWTPEQRASFANDPQNLTATTQVFNSWKSDKTPSEMLDNEQQLDKHDVDFTGKCFYATEYTAVVAKYELPVRQIDADALSVMLATCN